MFSNLLIWVPAGVVWGANCERASWTASDAFGAIFQLINGQSDSSFRHCESGEKQSFHYEKIDSAYSDGVSDAMFREENFLGTAESYRFKEVVGMNPLTADSVDTGLGAFKTSSEFNTLPGYGAMGIFAD